MCGLVGAAGILGKEERHAFRMLLQLDTVRGPHSTGVFLARNKGSDKQTLHKSLGTPWDFAKENHEHFSIKGVPEDGAYLLLGHNRYATVGAINEDNAHPFWYGDIAGAHNGTLKKGWERMLDEGNTFTVDSDCLMYNIDKHGVEDTYAKLNGAAALTWYDASSDTINMVRNHERPLTFAYTEDGKALFWASESWMIREALAGYGIKHKDIMVINPHYHMKVALHMGKKSPEEVSFGKINHYVQPVFKQHKKNKTKIKLVSPRLTPKNTGGKQDTNPKSALFDSSELALAKGLVGKSLPFYIDTMNPDDNSVFYGFTLDDHISIRIKFTDEQEQARRHFESEFQSGWFIGEPSFVGYGDNISTITLNILPQAITQLLDWTDFPPKSTDCSQWVNESDYLSLIDAAFIMDDNEVDTYYINGKPVESEHAEKILSVGCGWCSHHEDLDNWGEITIMDNNTYLCADCSNDKGVLQSCGQTYY